MRKPAVSLLAAGIILSVGFLFSACGGGATPGVASIGTTTTTTAPSQGTGGPGNVQEDGLEFAKCTRAHGVKDYPEPTKTGTTLLDGIDTTSPTFKAAQKDCQSLLPAPPAAQQRQRKQDLLEFAKCVRAHGVTNFPDPQSLQRGFFGFSLTAMRKINANSPQFQAAYAACKSLLPPGTSFTF